MTIINELQTAITDADAELADAAADLTDIADSLALRYGKLETDRSIIRRSIAEAVDALIDAEREAVEPAEESKK